MVCRNDIICRYSSLVLVGSLDVEMLSCGLCASWQSGEEEGVFCHTADTLSVLMDHSLTARSIVTWFEIRNSRLYYQYKL